MMRKKTLSIPEWLNEEFSACVLLVKYILCYVYIRKETLI